MRCLLSRSRSSHVRASSKGQHAGDTRGRVRPECAGAIGATDWRIMLTAVLPNLQSTVLVQFSLAMSFAILTEAALSFLGLGIQPPTPAWGSMLGDARQYITVAWWLTAFPGLAIFLTVLSFNFIGDGLREALDPKAATVLNLMKIKTSGSRLAIAHLRREKA